MAPELVLVILALALFGVVVWLLALPVGRRWLRSHDRERVAWWRLTLPLFAGALVFAFLLGWAFQETTPSDERVGVGLCLLALLTLGIAVRAGNRALRSLFAGDRRVTPIGTIGLLRPRIVVSDHFRASVSDDVLAAALAHEDAHVKRRDPLRIWLAQLAADVQWPVPGTARRFSAWLLALEVECDDEAVRSGIASDDLAEAILAAARLHHKGDRLLPGAHAAGGGDGIAWRVRRLLEGSTWKASRRPRSPWVVPASCFALLAVAVWMGVHYGDAAVRMLPGVGR